MSLEEEKKFEIDCTKEDRAVAYRLWPESFLGLYDMGFRAFERLISYRPSLLIALQLPPETEKWRTNERMKKIVLSLEQTLVRAVATYCDSTEHDDDTPELFSQHMQELGGLHRIIAPALLPDNFELMFKLLPEVIADVTSARREEGPMSMTDRAIYVNVWNCITVVMTRHFSLGWERRVLPTNPKYAPLIKKVQQETDRRRSLELQQQPARGRAATDSLSGPASGSRRATSRNGPNRSHTQVDLSPTSHNGSYLERGNSAPIALTDLTLEFTDLCDLSSN